MYGIMTEELVILDMKISITNDEFRVTMPHINSNHLWKPYRTMRCAASTRKSWKRKTCLYKGKMAGWSLIIEIFIERSTSPFISYEK